ncbi:MAG: ASKHA domain-containing protein [Dehalococcoidia bacterium]
MSPLIHGDERLDLVADRSLFDYADTLSVRVPTSCGRTGECHECIVEVRQGKDALSPLTDAESFLRGTYRLACQARVVDPGADVEFAVLRRQPRILTKGVRRDIKPEPLTVQRDGGVFFDGPDGPVRLDDYRGAIYGLAVDIGTTTVVMNLVNLENGETVYTASFENPQRFGGSDIMNRISYDAGKFKGELQAVMLSSINFEVGDMCRRLKVRRRQIYEMVMVGNATMREIFFGFDVQSIGLKPYKSMVEQEYLDGKRKTTALDLTAGELGVRIHPKANVYGGPLIGSHVGADVSADLLAIGMEEAEEPVVLVDVGTNTEVVVGTKDRMLAASCPAGPAFEGGEVKYGMPGYDGAVEMVTLGDDGLSAWRTINDKPPQGICGSGLIDLLAELRRVNLMTELGQFGDGIKEFTFVPEVGLTLSRADISALAQAKAANYCGQSIVIREYGLPISQFSKLYLAGGFANYVDERNAVAIGFIANVPADRIVKVGNASLEGATIMLISGPKRREIEELVKTIRHIELETTPDFFDFFVEGCQFKPMAEPPVKPA